MTASLPQATPPPPTRPLAQPLRGLWCPQRSRLRGRLGTALAMAGALLVGGCQAMPASMGVPEHLQVAIATGDGLGSDEVVRTSLRRLSGQMATEFMRSNPRVNLHLRFVPESELLASLRDRTGLGAGPDLLISRVAPTAILVKEGLVVPSDLGPEQLDPLRISFLSRFRNGPGYRALPFLLQPSIACYDRRRLPTPPATLEALLSRASEGVRVGLPLVADELLWTASGFGAALPLLQTFEEGVGSRHSFSMLDRERLLTWLNWLYRANVQPTLHFVDDSDELVRRLGSGQLDWISCNATAIPRLKRSMGTRLGVALLPAGPDGEPAEPMARLQLLSFGRDSTPAQRRIAERFALFVLNDFSQNNLMVRAVGNMPVNQNVIVPVKDSPELASIQRSLEASIVPNLREGIGIRRHKAALHQLLKKNVYGELSPEKVLEGIDALPNANP